MATGGKDLREHIFKSLTTIGWLSNNITII